MKDSVQSSNSMSKGASAMSFAKAQKLRTRMTDAENIFWEAVRKNKFDGLKFRRQHPITVYILDFYCHKYRLGVELDGGYHEDTAQSELDAQRDKELCDQGLNILRFKNEEVTSNLEKVLNRIRKEIEIIKRQVTAK